MSSISSSTSAPSSYLRDLQQELEEELRRSRQNSDAEDSRREERVAEMKERLEKESARAADMMRRSHEESFARERDLHREELLRVRNEGYDRRGRSLAGLEEERWALAQQARRAGEESRRQAEKAAHEEEASSARRTAAWRRSDSEHAEQIRRREAEHQASLDDLHRQVDTSLEQLGHRDTGEQKNFERALEAQHEELSRQFEKTHRRQADTYDGRLRENRDRSEREIGGLHGELVAARTTPDPRRVSPAAYDRIQRDASRRTDAAIRQREDVHQENLAAVKERARQENEERDVTRSGEISRLLREKHSEESRHRTQESLWAAGSEERLSDSRYRQDRKLERALDRQERAHARELDTLRRRNQESLSVFRDDASSKSRRQREDTDLQSQMTRKAFYDRQNELIRDYEKRLDDARAESEELLQRGREDTGRSLRELERRHREEMEEAEGLSSKRVAQLEEQYRNRERVMARNYQEEIEKLKRAHAQLQSQKS